MIRKTPREPSPDRAPLLPLSSRWRRGSLLLALLLLSCSRPAQERTELRSSSSAQSASQAASSAAPPAVPERPAASDGAMSTEPERARTLAPPLDKRGHYGAEFTGAAKQQLNQVLAKPEQYQDKPMTLSGVVQRVCQRKGCWMELASSKDAKAARCRIRFKDYGFFVPTNSEGAKAQVEGVLMVNKVAPARVKHLEEEGAVFDAKNADGSAFETQLIASAVELER